MADLSLRYNPTGEAVVTLVDEQGSPVEDFGWKAVVLPRETDLLVQLRTTDESQGSEVTTCPLTETVEARDQAVMALRDKAREEGFEINALVLGAEQEEPLP